MSEPDTPDSADTPDSTKPQDAPATAAPSTAHLHGMEHRDSARHVVRWHADVLLDGRPCQGIVHEVSESGATLFLELNPQKAKRLSLNLHLPPPDDKHGQHIVEVEGRIVYSIHDSQEQLFRAGVLFSKFAKESDPAFLTSYLNGH